MIQITKLFNDLSTDNNRRGRTNFNGPRGRQWVRKSLSTVKFMFERTMKHTRQLIGVLCNTWGWIDRISAGLWSASSTHPQNLTTVTTRRGELSWDWLASLDLNELRYWKTFHITQILMSRIPYLPEEEEVMSPSQFPNIHYILCWSIRFNIINVICWSIISMYEQNVDKIGLITRSLRSGDKGSLKLARRIVEVETGH